MGCSHNGYDCSYYGYNHTITDTIVAVKIKTIIYDSLMTIMVKIVAVMIV